MDSDFSLSLLLLLLLVLVLLLLPFIAKFFFVTIASIKIIVRINIPIELRYVMEILQ